MTTDHSSPQHRPGDGPADLTAVLEALREQLVPEDAPVPSEQLRTAFESGLGATPSLPVPMPRPRRAGCRRLAAVGTVAVLALGGTGAAGALPGAAQAAFDRTTEAVGLTRRATPALVPTVAPAAPADIDLEERPDDVGTTPDGRTFAEGSVVPHATDATSPGIDDPATVAEDARDLGPDDPATDGTERAPVDTPAPAPAKRPGPAEPGAPVDAGGPPAPAEELAPERPGAGDDPRTSRPGGAP